MLDGRGRWVNCNDDIGGGLFWRSWCLAGFGLQEGSL